jgi:hypothetical protein
MTFYPNEETFFSSVLRFNQRIVILAATLGQLAKELRAQANYGDPSAALDEVYLLERQNRIFEMQGTFRETWMTEKPAFIPDNWLESEQEHDLPPRIQGIFEHVSWMFWMFWMFFLG